MTEYDFTAEVAEAHRRAAHLIMCRSVEDSDEMVVAELAKLANDEDAIFAAAVAGALLSCLDGELRKLPVDERRGKAFGLLAAFASTDLTDLDNLGAGER